MKNGKRRSRWNFRRANWTLFKTEVDVLLDPVEINKLEVEEANSLITESILKASKSSIPRGCVKKYSPFWNDQLQKSVEMRQSKRKEYEQNPTPGASAGASPSAKTSSIVDGNELEV